MPQISLTDFVDIVSRSGRQKATKVRQVKMRPQYEPARDYYKAFREHVADTHRNKGTREDVSDVLDTVDVKKLGNYRVIAEAYTKWWGRKDLRWFEPPRGTFSANGVDIHVNPELGLRINGDPYVIKLYFKDAGLDAFKADIIVDLLEHQLRPVAAAVNFGVLDVRERKLFAEGPHTPDLTPIVVAELAYVASIWNA